MADLERYIATQWIYPDSPENPLNQNKMIEYTQTIVKTITVKDTYEEFIKKVEQVQLFVGRGTRELIFYVPSQRYSHICDAAYTLTISKAEAKAFSESQELDGCESFKYAFQLLKTHLDSPETMTALNLKVYRILSDAKYLTVEPVKFYAHGKHVSTGFIVKLNNRVEESGITVEPKNLNDSVGRNYHVCGSLNGRYINGHYKANLLYDLFHELDVI